MVQKVTEVNMEELARVLVEHEVAGVSVSDSECVSGHALPSNTLDVSGMHAFDS